MTINESTFTIKITKGSMKHFHRLKMALINLSEVFDTERELYLKIVSQIDMTQDNYCRKQLNAKNS